MKTHSLTVIFNIPQDRGDMKDYRMLIETARFFNNEDEAEIWLEEWDKKLMMEEFFWDTIYDWRFIRMKESSSTSISWRSLNRPSKAERERNKRIRTETELRHNILINDIKLINEEYVEIANEHQFSIVSIIELVRTLNDIMIDQNCNIIAQRFPLRNEFTKVQLNNGKLRVNDGSDDYVIDVRKILANKLDHNEYE